MSYAMLVGGALTLPAERMAEYLAHSVDPSKRKGWPGMLAGRGEPSGPVGGFLRALPRRLITKAGSWLDIAIAPSGEVKVHGVLVEDDFLDHGANLADAFRAAAESGGAGVLYLLEEQVPYCPQEPELCYVIRVEPGRSKVQHPTEKEQAKVITGELFAAVLEHIEAAMAASGFAPATRRKVKKPAAKRAAAPGAKKPAAAKAKTPKTRRG